MRKLIALTLLVFTGICLVLPLAITEAAVVKGTSAGFVTVAPTDDPAGSNATFDNTARAIKDVAPAGATTITEVGWYCDNATEASNYELGIYDHNAVDNSPGNQLFVTSTNAKGTGAGWKTAAVSWSITAGTTYWIALQIDDTATATMGNYSGSTGDRYSAPTAAQTTLLNPWPASDEYNNDYLAIYAVYTTGGTATNKCYYRRQM